MVSPPDIIRLTLFRYFQHFHPYMPVIRHRDPNKCYDTCPLLFWTIVFVASRRYARGNATFSFLLDAIQKEFYSAISTFPLTVHHINALILICSWCFPDVRFIKDPTVLFSGVAMTACLLLGIHLGTGRHKEFTMGVFQSDFSDEEAVFAWCGYNIVSQRSYRVPCKHFS